MPKKTKTSKPKNLKTSKLVLLDAHAIIHRAYHALPEFATSSGEPTGALYGLSTMLIKILKDINPDYVAACFDLPGPTHRHEAYDEYKAGRSKNDDNLTVQLERAKDVFRAFGVPIYSQPGFEADDILGTVVEDLKEDKGTDIIIASGDMDTLQLVDGKKVQVYTLKRGLNDTVMYDEKGVMARFGFKPELLPDYKGLRGDPSDNIVGVKGVGEKTATSLITTFGTIENIYKELKKDKEKVKEKAGITERIAQILLDNEEEALFSKTLATIRTDAPVNFTLPKPWREALEIDRVLELYDKLEFRTLGQRVKNLLQEANSKKQETREQETNKIQKNKTQETTKEVEANKLISQQAKKLCLTLWVIDSNISNPDIEDVLRFTKSKTLDEAEKVIEQELDKRNVRNVYEDIELPIMPIVEEMTERGIKVDKKFLGRLSKEYHAELTKIEAKIWKHAGEDFNINSPKELSRILFDKLDLGGNRQKKTPSGQVSTKESELAKLVDKHPIFGLILEYRELSKLLSTYIDAIPPQLDKSSRLHSTFQQAGTTTGRLSSVNPNLQNIPNKTALGRAIRKAFVAEKGFKLVALDYSQIELRIAAILSKDAKLIEIFKNGEDVHSGVASRVFDVPQAEVDKGMRIQAKTINFGILYGMGVNALTQNLKTTRKEAQEFYNEYFETFTGLASYLDSIKAEAGRKGYTETLFGRRRYFSGLKSPLPYVRAQAERMAINAPIQGTSADIIKIAMKKIDDYIKQSRNEGKARLLLQVHDELVYEVEESLVDTVAGEFKRIMEHIIPEEKTLGVPITVDVNSGQNWGEMEEVDSK